TTKDLTNHRKKGPEGGLYNRFNSIIKYDSDMYERVVIIASDITTESKIIFPEMASLYWSTPEQVNPAEYVRASMSIPFFFHPFKVKNIPNGKEAWALWKEKTGYEGNTPAEVTFIDGGVMSNFPIDVFHEKEHVPICPTFGVKLGADRVAANSTDKLFGFIGAMFNSARHI